MPCVVKELLKSEGIKCGCIKAHFWMVVKAEHTQYSNEKCCIKAHFWMVVKDC